MPEKKPELQVPLEDILDHKEGKYGKVFYIKVAHYNPMWVPAQKLSKGAANSHLIGAPLPKKAFVVLARRYSKPPLKMDTMSISTFFSGKRGPSKVSQEEFNTPVKKKSRSDGDTKKTKKNKRVITKQLIEGWCGQSRAYIKRFNSILNVQKKSDYVKLIKEAQETLKPNKESLHLFSSEKFLTGKIIKHNKENINCLSCSTKTTGEIRCEVCDESFKVSHVCRVINHCFSQDTCQKTERKTD